MADIKGELLARLDSLLADLLPGGKRAGNYYFAKNPRRNDRHANSFWIRRHGNAKGAWRDEATGDKGDVFDLIAFVMGHRDRKETFAWAKDFLGIGATPIAPEILEARRLKREAEEAERAKEEAEDLAKKRKAAAGMWHKAEAELSGTPVELYLRARGIELSRFASPPRVLRHIPAHDHRDEDGVVTTWPCMIAAITGADGQIVAVHRTWLLPGGGKAPVAPVKKIWPWGWKGGAIRIHKGAGNLSPEQAMQRRAAPLPLIICEGIEDALTFKLAVPEYRIWAAGTLGNMGELPIGHFQPIISRVIIAQDNDWSEQARANFERGRAAIEAHGLPVFTARSPRGKDANDLLLGK